MRCDGDPHEWWTISCTHAETQKIDGKKTKRVSTEYSQKKKLCTLVACAPASSTSISCDLPNIYLSAPISCLCCLCVGDPNVFLYPLYMFSFASAQIDDLYGGKWQVGKHVSCAPNEAFPNEILMWTRYFRGVRFFSLSLSLFIHFILLVHNVAIEFVSGGNVASIFHFPRYAFSLRRE